MLCSYEAQAPGCVHVLTVVASHHAPEQLLLVGPSAVQSSNHVEGQCMLLPKDALQDHDVV